MFSRKQIIQTIEAKNLKTINETIGEDVMERVLDVLSFDASEREEETFVVTSEYVKERLSEIVKDQDLSRYIL